MILSQPHRRLGAIAVLASAVMTASSFSQDPFAPMGGGAAPDPFAPTTAPPAGGNPFGGPPPAAPLAPASAPLPTARTVSESLANRVLAQNPETVDELMRAVRDLSNLGNGKLVKDMVAKLEATGLDENQLADLEQRWGAGLFTRLALEPAYAPEGRKFAQRVLDAAKQRRAAVPRLNALLSDAIGDDPAKRSIAMRELRAAGEAIYPVLITRLQDPSRNEEHPQLVAAAAALGELVDPAMAAAVDADDELLQTNAAFVLGLRKQRAALVPLLEYGLADGVSDQLRGAAREALQAFLGGIPTKEEATRYLKQRAREFHAGGALGVGDLEGQVVLWSWDATKSTIQAEYWLVRDASVLQEARAARAVYAVAPDAADHLRLRLMTGLAAAKVRGGIDQPVQQQAILQLCERAGAEQVIDVLREAMGEQRPLAAAGAAEVLGDLGDGTVLFSRGRPAVLCRALNADQPRVRFAALSSIMKLASREPFWGSSVAMERLTQAVTAAGSDRVLVGHPEVARGQTWAGLLSESGIPADVVQTGKEAADQATRHIDYQVILLSSRIQRPLLRETIQRLREQPACRQMPIGILCAASDLFPCQDLAEDYERVEAFPVPYTGARVYEIYTRLLSLYHFPPTSPSVRLRQSRQALGWLANLADKRGKYAYFDIERAQQAAMAALPLPESSDEAARVLGKIGNRPCQLALVDLASVATLPLQMRRASVAAFKEAVSRRGLMLYSKEVKEQYDRYNQSVNLPQSTQQLLGEVLDMIESTIPRSALGSPPPSGQSSTTGG